jgi:hypothetical protein
MSSDYLSLMRDRKDIIATIIILPSHGIYIYNNWRPGGTVFWIWNLAWLSNQSRLWLYLFCQYQLRTVRCCVWWSGHRLIILSTYLLMGAERLVTLLSWVPALFGPAFRGGY